MSFLILFYANQLISSLGVFTATMWATIKRTVPSTTAHTVTSPCQGTLNIYVCPSNITFARITVGDTSTDSALMDIVTVAIPLDTCLMIVWLRTLSWNRLYPSLQEIVTRCYYNKGQYILSLGLNCTKEVILWFCSLGHLFSLSPQSMLYLTS